MALRSSGTDAQFLRNMQPQEYLETDIYKASREIKKMQKLNSNVLTTWYDIVPERNELPCKKLVSNKE